MTSKKLRRKTIYLGWKNHGRIVARFALLWVIYHFTLWEALCTREYIQYLNSISDVEHRIPLAVFFADFVRQNAWMIVFAAAFAVIILWDVVRLTHRIVGPLKRLENVLYAMADGKSVNQVKFREGDLIESFEKAFNAYLSSRHASNDPADGTAAARDAAAESPMPASRPEERCEPATPLDDQQMAELFHDLRPVNGSAGLVHERAD
jgi:methyl-accepting chemotaxis protein